MTSQLIHDLIGRFSRLHVLVVGDPILDEYVTGDCTRISPEAPIPVLRVRDTRAVLGGAANTAANVAALGGRVTLVGPRGADAAGARLEHLVARHGIDSGLVPDTRPTVRKVRALGGQQQLLRLDYEQDLPLSDTVASGLLDVVRARMGGVSIVVVSDYAKGVVSPGFCGQLFELARRAGVPVVVDPRPQHADCYRGCDYLTPNWHEALGLLGIVESPLVSTTVGNVGPRLVQRFDTNVLLTLGARGLRFFGRAGDVDIDEAAQAREVFDVSGAGDTVVAAFALAAASGADIRSSLQLANLAASVVVAKVGTATVSAAELRRQVDGTAGRAVEVGDLARLADELRRSGRRIALVTGEFSPVQARHLAQLQQARREGDVVVVVIRRGDEPGTASRLRVLMGLRDVDFVSVVDEPGHAIEHVRPDVILDGESGASGHG